MLVPGDDKIAWEWRAGRGWDLTILGEEAKTANTNTLIIL